MDSISQAALGAAIGEAIFGRKIGGKAALAGALIATIPDLDVVGYLWYSPYEMLTIHRGLSHSILFSFLGAMLLAFFLSKLKLFKSISVRQAFLFSWLCLFTHILLDACTAYGTQLFSPFSDQRIGLDSINVVDPVYTVPLLIGLILSIWIFRNNELRSRYTNWALMISTLYLLFTLGNKSVVETFIAKHFKTENIEYTKLMTMPVGVANIKWYGVAKSIDSIYMISYNRLSGETSPLESFPVNEMYLSEIDEAMADKMRWFAKGFYTVEKVESKIRIYNLQVDMRGIRLLGDRKVPTAGYFEIGQENGSYVFSSGTILD